MIQLFLNGKPVTLSQSMSLDLALQEWKKNNIGIIPETFAISINEQFIPKTQYTATILQTNDCIDLLIPMQGG